MEGLFQPIHLVFLMLLTWVLLVPIAIAIWVARYRRSHCTWQLAKAKRRLRVGIRILVYWLLIPVLGLVLNSASAFVLVMIVCWFVPVVGVYQISKAVYRQRDIKSAILTALAP